MKPCVIRDLDALAPRPKLPPRALPDEVRSKMGFAPPVPGQEPAPKPAAAATRSSLGGASSQSSSRSIGSQKENNEEKPALIQKLMHQRNATVKTAPRSTLRM